MCSTCGLRDELSVAFVRPKGAINSLHTPRVQGGLVNAGNHPDLSDRVIQGRRVKVAFLLLGNLLPEKVVLRRWRSWSESAEWRRRTLVKVRFVFTHLPRSRNPAPYISRVFDRSAPLALRFELSSYPRCCFAAELAIGEDAFHTRMKRNTF